MSIKRLKMKRNYLYLPATLIQILPFIWCVCWSLFSCGTSRPSCFGLPEAGFGASSANGLWSLLNNPAGHASMKKASFGVTFETAGIKNGPAKRSLCAAVPLGSGNAGFVYQEYGVSSYRLRRIALVYGRLFGENTRIGVSLHYRNEMFREYGNVSSATFSAGMQKKLGHGLVAGLSLHDPFVYILKEQAGTSHDAGIALGFRWDASPDLGLIAEYINHNLRSGSWYFGCCYNITSRMMAGLCLATSPMVFAFGIALGISGFSVGMSGSFHPWLGNASSVTLAYLNNDGS